jgi:hypothetical protein
LRSIARCRLRSLLGEALLTRGVEQLSCAAPRWRDAGIGRSAASELEYANNRGSSRCAVCELSLPSSC